MSAFEGSSAQLTQGISQQIARDRQPGQVEDQLNMLSDMTTGPRRRPGAQLRKAVFASNDSTYGMDSFFLGYTDISGERYRVVVDTSVGDLTLYDSQYNLQEVIRNPYLTASSAKAIRVAVVGDRLIVANTEKKPKAGPVVWEGPSNTGYFFVRQGAFSKKFDVTVTDLNTDKVITFSYFTLDAAQPNAAVKTSPEAIMWRLYDAWVALPAEEKPFEISLYAQGSSMFVQGPPGSNLSITSNSGDTYVQTSSARQLQTISGLPPTMHPNAQWMLMAIGKGTALVYYRWDVPLQAWVEAPAPGRPDTLTDTPLVITKGGSALTVTTEWPGCKAGDQDSNPDPEFMNYGVTGLAAYQGRLVVLSGPFVSLSSSKDPTTFYRTTVDQLLDSDPIHIGSSANMAAPYQYALPFQKDLLLFADRYQAVIPGGNTAITPRTALVVVTSEYVSDLGCSPIGLGRTVMYATPRNAQHFGIMEMAPSSYTDSMYTSHDVTNHLPRWFEGKARWAVSSSISSMAAYGGTENPRDVYVHEYLWSGDEKVQQAWHRWQLPYPVVACCFAADEIEFLLMLPGRWLALVSLDPRQRSFPGETPRTPYLDLWVEGNVVNHNITFPGVTLLADAGLLDIISLEQAEGPQAGDAVGVIGQNGPGPDPDPEPEPGEEPGGPAPGEDYTEVPVPVALYPKLVSTIPRRGSKNLELIHKIPEGYAGIWLDPGVGALGLNPTLVIYDEEGVEVRAAELALGKYSSGAMAGLTVDYGAVAGNKVYVAAFTVDPSTYQADFGIAVIDCLTMQATMVDLAFGADLSNQQWSSFSTLALADGSVLAGAFDGLYKFNPGEVTATRVFTWPSSTEAASRSVVLSHFGDLVSVYAKDQYNNDNRMFTYNPATSTVTEVLDADLTSNLKSNVVRMQYGSTVGVAWSDTEMPFLGRVRFDTEYPTQTYGPWTFRPTGHVALAALSNAAPGGLHFVGPTGWFEVGVEGLPDSLAVTHISMDGSQYTGCSMQDDTFYLWRVAVDLNKEGKGWIKGAARTMAAPLADAPVLKTVRSYPEGKVFVGLPYRSSITPTEPFVTDREGRKIGTNRCTLLRYIVTTAYSPEYTVELTEKGWATSEQDVGTVFWASTDLAPDTPRSPDGDAACVVPVRVDAERASVTFSQEGAGELNIVGLEFILRYNAKHTRY